MQTLSEIRELLASHGLRPKHRLGQNFLHDKNQLTRLVDAAEICAGDLVLEVGPGTGTLTEELLARGAEVIACELDPDLVGIVRDRLGANSHFRLIEGDALEKQRTLSSKIVEQISGRAFKLVANLPYQAASPLMSTLLIDYPNCVGQFVTIQKEVADRLLAKPSTKEYGPLSIIVQAFAEVKKIATLGPSCFWPPPDVTSAMVAISPSPSAGEKEVDGRSPSPSGRGVRNEGDRAADAPLKSSAGRALGPHLGPPATADLRLPKGEGVRPYSSDDRRAFARFVVDLFTKRRKQLGTIFGRERSDWRQGVTPDLRPEALTVEQLIALWRTAGRLD